MPNIRLLIAGIIVITRAALAQTVAVQYDHALPRGIFRMARERGIDTYIVKGNIFVSPELSRAYGVATDNLDHKIHARGILRHW